MTTINDVPKGIKRKIYNSTGLLLNMSVSHIPSRHFRRFFYRFCGTEIASNSVIFRTADVLWPMGINIGKGSSVGAHTLVDGRGGGNNWK